jgi:HSP20 family protein
MVKMIRREPFFKEIEEFFNDQDFFGFVPAVRRYLVPPMDVYQTEKEVVVEVQIPKMDPKNVSVTIENGVLKIEGRQEEQSEQDNKEYYRREIRSGSFSRSITLPTDVKESEIDAKFEAGVLKVVIPKTEPKQPKKIEVKVK